MLNIKPMFLLTTFTHELFVDHWILRSRIREPLCTSSKTASIWWLKIQIVKRWMSTWWCSIEHCCCVGWEFRVETLHRRLDSIRHEWSRRCCVGVWKSFPVTDWVRNSWECCIRWGCGRRILRHRCEEHDVLKFQAFDRKKLGFNSVLMASSLKRVFCRRQLESISR